MIGLNAFYDAFISCLKIPLTMGHRHPRIENTLEFAAKFAVSFCTFTNDNSMEELTPPFLVKLFDFLLTHHNAKELAVRFRICHFLNMLLNSMGEQAFIDDALCDQITESMMERLLDKSAKVRAQAIFALHRLQDPSDDDCQVIQLYIFHVSKDPKAEVRKAALASMGKNQKTLQVALRRTRDIDAGVRKMAYEFISKVTVRSLTIKQRDELLNDGLTDRAEIVRQCVHNVLLPSWLGHLKDDYLSLVRALDAEIGTDTSVLALNTLFKPAAINTLISQVPLGEETKLIPITKLCSENVLYWRCLVKYLHRESFTDELEMIIPELSNFCIYIHSYLAFMSLKQYEMWEKQTQRFILLQLFEIVTIYDLSDEAGRKKLNDLILHTLMTDHCTEKIIECIVSHLATVLPDVHSRLDTLANVISEIRLPSKETAITQVSLEQEHDNNMQRAKLKVMLLELKEEEYQAIQEKDYLKADSLKDRINALNQEISKLMEQPELMITDDIREEKNDRETMVKCLTIMYAMMQSVNTLTPTLRSLMQIALQSLDHPDDSVHILALKVVGVCCLFDKELAKKHVMMFFLQFSMEQENQEIWVIALKAIFDLLLLYGFEHFDITGSLEESMNNKSKTVKLYNNTDQSISCTRSVLEEEGSCNFMKILTSLLDNANQELRTIAAEGLCKLILNRRISGSRLLSRLIILCYNPANDGDIYLRQCLSSFFDYFVKHIPDAQEMLEGAFMPTLQVLCNAPDMSPLQEIDPYDVARFILSLTRIDKPGVGTYCAHNNLAFAILAELLNPDTKIDHETLIKSLKNLDIQVDDHPSKENLLEAVNKVLTMVTESESRLVKYIEQFKKKFTTPNVEAMEDENTESED
ncbi:hypothetical protein KM043_009811 [Ampulex compressa]|nr:hypothetical protein KM043_009811 [Ampulex compressa]